MSERRSTGEEEIKRECSVLLEVLQLWPTILSFDELIRALVIDPSDARGTEHQRQAIRELCRYGLLRRDGANVFPTMAAVRVYEMFEL